MKMFGKRAAAYAMLVGVALFWAYPAAPVHAETDTRRGENVSAMFADSDAAREASAGRTTDTTQNESDEALLPPELAGAALRMFAAMAVVLAALIGGFILFKRYAAGRFRGMTGAAPVRVLDRVSLGPKQYACVVRACGRHLLLGVTEREVSLLVELDLGDTPPEGDFPQVFGEAAARTESRPASPPQPAEGDRG